MVGCRRRPLGRDQGVINMIIRGESASGDNLVKKKEHAYHVFSVGTIRHPLHQLIIFTLEDGEGMSCPHDDLMVVVAYIDGFTMKKILVDNGSSYNVLT